MSRKAYEEHFSDASTILFLQVRLATWVCLFCKNLLSSLRLMCILNFLFIGYTSIKTFKDAGHDLQIDFPTHKQITTHSSV